MTIDVAAFLLGCDSGFLWFMAMRLFGYSCWALWMCLQHFVVCVGVLLDMPVRLLDYWRWLFWFLGHSFGIFGYDCKVFGYDDEAFSIWVGNCWHMAVRALGFWLWAICIWMQGVVDKPLVCDCKVFWIWLGFVESCGAFCKGLWGFGDIVVMLRGCEWKAL